MSKDSTQDAELRAATAASPATAKKKTAKKAAKKAGKAAAKKTSKKAAKKATKASKTAKKTAAKKTTAKKAAAKKSAKKEPKVIVEQAVLPLEGSGGAEDSPKKAMRATRRTAAPKLEPRADGEEPRAEPPRTKDWGDQLETAVDSPVKFGRVPGGGPVSREQGGEKVETSEQPKQNREGGRRDDRRDHGERRDRGERSERGEGNNRRKRRRKRRGDRGERGDRDQRGDRGERDQRGDRGERDQRGDRGERDQRGDRGERDGRSNRGDRRGGRRGDRREDRRDEDRRDAPATLEGPKLEVNGILELTPKGFGFLRVPEKNFEQARDDVFVSPDLVRKYGLRVGLWIKGLAQQGSRGQQLVEITSVNDLPPDEVKLLPAFEELTAINPNKRVSFETVQDRYTTRVLDLVSPVGRGQRGLIVSPPRSGKTTILLHIAEAVQELHEETMHLMVLLVDERPEEVTEFRRSLPGVEVYASSNDDPQRNHTRIAEICIERAKRLVEGGQHVFLLMDSITRLARAYNAGMRSKGRGIGSGGIMVGALEAPRRLFAAARNTREAGSLTILATALVQTNSRADDAIFQEFKGTGNMELVLDRQIAENYIYPAVDIFKSGTRREELLLPEHTLHKIHMIRRGLAGHRPLEAMQRLRFFLEKFPSNPQMLLEIKG